MSEITFVGDVFIQGDCEINLPYENLVANLEAPVTDSDDAALNKINLRTSAGDLERCKGFSPLAVCLANNHICDFSSKGFADTVLSLIHI